MPSLTGTLEGVAVPMTEFLKLTRIPVVVYCGDNIPTQPSEHPGDDNRRARLAMATLRSPRRSRFLARRGRDRWTLRTGDPAASAQA